MPHLHTHDNIEFEPIEQIEALNNKLLQMHVAYCFDHSPYYRKLFKSQNINPKHIRTQKDLHLLPFTRKEDIERSARDFLCVNAEDIADVCQTSGTTGNAVVFQQTAFDLKRLGYNEKISFLAAGVTTKDRVMIACALGRCFMAGIAYFEGIRMLGATAIRAGSGNPHVLAGAVLLHRPSVLICVPSQAAAVAEKLLQENKDPSQLGVRLLLCIGEPIRTAAMEFLPLGARLKQLWKCDVLSTYASTEMATSFTDCVFGNGGHFHPELITVELIDEQGNPVGPGELGEVVVTPLQVTGMPLLRYCTGDIATYYTEPCSCGRRSYRLAPIVGRKQQKMKINGTTVYPNAIFTVLQQMPEVKNYYLEVYGRYALSESIRVVVGIDNPANGFTEIVAEKIRGHIRVKPEVVVISVADVASKTVLADKRKSITFFDARQYA
jgi:phenylacetate-CoA ligase